MGQDLRNQKDTKSKANAKLETKILSVVKSNDRRSEEITSNLIIEPADIASLHILSEPDAHNRYNITKGTLVMIVTLNPDVKLIKPSELFDKYDLGKNYRSLKIRLDGKKVVEPDDILLEIKAIQSVSVNKKDNYIEILTKNAVRLLEKNKKDKSPMMIN